MRHPFLFWITRLLGFLIAGFVYLFLIEVFSAGFQLGAFVLISFWGTLYLSMTLLSWKYPASSGIVFIISGILYLFFAIGQLTVLAIAVFSGVPLFVGVLMMIEGIHRSIQEKNVSKG